MSMNFDGVHAMAVSPADFMPLTDDAPINRVRLPAGPPSMANLGEYRMETDLNPDSGGTPATAEGDHLFLQYA